MLVNRQKNHSTYIINLRQLNSYLTDSHIFMYINFIQILNVVNADFFQHSTDEETTFIYQFYYVSMIDENMREIDNLDII